MQGRVHRAASVCTAPPPNILHEKDCNGRKFSVHNTRLPTTHNTLDNQLLDTTSSLGTLKLRPTSGRAGVLVLRCARGEAAQRYGRVTVSRASAALSESRREGSMAPTRPLERGSTRLTMRPPRRPLRRRFARARRARCEVPTAPRLTRGRTSPTGRRPWRVARWRAAAGSARSP
eukprot:4769780-Prymnesium_polylepis.2